MRAPAVVVVGRALDADRRPRGRRRARAGRVIAPRGDEPRLRGRRVAARAVARVLESGQEVRVELRAERGEEIRRDGRAPRLVEDRGAVRRGEPARGAAVAVAVAVAVAEEPPRRRRAAAAVGFAVVFAISVPRKEFQ